MIIKDLLKIRKDGVKLYISYSDQGLKIQKDGTKEIYDEAIDIETSEATYTETDQPIDEGEEATAEELLQILLGEEA